MDKLESLVNSWVRFSLVLRNEKLVSTLTYNETVICGMINKNGNEMQFKNLSKIMNMSKSLLTRSLNDLEKRGIVVKYNKDENHKNIYISLTPNGRETYLKEHEHALMIAKKIEAISEGKIDIVIDTFNRISDSIDIILDEGEKR